MSSSQSQMITSRLVFAIAAGAIGSSFQHGYNTGVLNTPQSKIESFINSTIFSRTGQSADKEYVETIFSLMTSIFCVGGMVGALCTAFVAQRFGRKGGLLLNNIFVFIGAFMMTFSKTFSSHELLVLGRFFIGINSGLAAGLAPMYLTEISPVHLRGAVGTIYQLIIVIAILIAYVLGFDSMLGTDTLWPYLFAVTLIPTIFMLSTLPFCPESPKHLLINQKREGHATSGLTWLRGTIEIHDEMEEMRQEAQSIELVPKVTLADMWRNPVYRQPLIISVMVMLSQQLSGINAVIFYSTAIFKGAGLEDSLATYATVGMSMVNVVMTVVSLVLVERFGRRTLHLFGLGGMVFTTILLTFCVQMKHILILSYLSVAMVYLFVIFFASGPGSIPWFLVGELFGSNARGLATSIAVAVNWGANFMVGLLFLPLQTHLQGYVFLVFTALLAFFWTYAYKKVPETKGRTSDEIAALFRQKSYQ
ncbi:solute carrier family 2, facilitated glucose transporter member 1-like isoform X3 [Brevipalpus obovatus]|uniref:solute carrier family 2, facilitated glucose transporter member 1-like isoform X3 n=1 Tax=Brevipalpus obovatus TaxID=246614 RepID=UPI003D9E9C2B